jgi:uncharacterized surface protein with fasciclin (FAS1) repeats
MKKRTVAAGLIAASLVFAACGDDNEDSRPAETAAPTTEAPMTTDAAEMGTIVDVAAGNPNFSTLVAAVQAAGLAETLSGEGPFTVFAPTNDAFAALPAGLLDALLLPENKDVLTSILTYHVVAGKVTSDQVRPGTVPTVEGSTIDLAVDGASVTLNGSVNVIATDVMASNGVIHVLDGVLVPPTVDVEALLAGGGAAEEPGTIVDIAAGNPDFSTLVAAVEAAGLVETLSGEGPFTVFAPTNDAFAKVDAAVLEKLLKPENKDALTAILTYHVVAGEVLAADVKPGDVPTVQGDSITVTVDGGTVKLNDSTVTATDIIASNGVIHVIDTVLLPPSLDLSTLK